ncbi:DUF6438 domain-containing protein [Winogradskyella sp. A2]|uniref:DUF6438 domain-containing protein n=1 Tax=Winogradskyella sp. A2 TaxID=3366944 RepID=UPI00398C748E
MTRILPFIICVSMFVSCAKKNVSAQQSKKTTMDSITDLNSLREFVKNADSTLRDFTCMVPHTYKSEELATSPIKQKLDSMIPKADYIKADLDGNGLQDLVITVKSQFSFHAMALMSLGDDNYNVIQLSSARNYNQFPIYTKLVMQNDVPTIEMYEKGSDFKKMDIKKTTLVYKNGAFVEYQDKISDYNITKIEFGTTGCFGTCPVFDMTIVPNGKSLFDAKYYNFSQQLGDREKEEGKFEAVIKPTDFETIVKMMNEINIKDLETSYTVGWTDDQTSKLKVYFADGSFKYVQDYGMQGTRGLELLYEVLLELRFNQEWVRL